MQLTLGDFVAIPFGPLADAAGVHTELKKLGIDAAVVDHAYILSKLQLSVSLSRVAPFAGVTAATISSSKQRHATIKEKVARVIFVSLSLTHNLDKVLQILPPGPSTSAVVVILSRHAATPEVLSTIRRVCEEKARPIEAPVAASSPAALAAAPRSDAEEDVEAFVFHALAARADPAKVMAFYGITEKDRRAVREGLTSQDVERLEAMARRCGPAASGVDAQLLINLRALELCVVNRLATADV